MATQSHPVICHACDALQTLPAPVPGQQARCMRCDQLLARWYGGGLDTPLALVLTAAVLFLIAGFAPLLSIELRGVPTGTTLAGTGVALYDSGNPLLAVAVLACTLVGPGLVIAAQLYVLLALHAGWRLPALRGTLLLISRVAPWGMLDVFLLGVVVALMKLVAMANIVPGAGLYAFGLLIPAILWAESRLDLHQLWDRLEEMGGC